MRKSIPITLAITGLLLAAATFATAGAATLTVTNLNDAGAGTLREAIDNANATAGADTIHFSVSGTLILGSTLPVITDAAGLTIDGTGQSIIVSGNTKVQAFTVATGAALGLESLSVTNGYHSGNGGGLYNSGTVTLNRCTFSGNKSDGEGGGLYNAAGGSASIANSTFANNTGQSLGGGLFNAGSISVTNSSMAWNSSVLGGGITNTGTLNLANTLLANNPGGDCASVGGSVQPSGTNLVKDGSCDPMAIAADPKLGPLTNNGGPTPTLALLPGSPAVDAAADALCAAPPVNHIDQRGVTRPQGAHCDIGAFEAGPDVFKMLSVTNLKDSGSGSLRSAISNANNTPDAVTIKFNVSGSIRLASPLPAITSGKGVTIDGVGQNLTVSGGGKVQVFSVAKGAILHLRNLTVTKGNSPNYVNGGGLNNQGSVSLFNCVFSGNNSNNTGGGNGGGLYNAGGASVSVVGSRFSGNGSGGIYNDTGGTVNVTDSTFSGNSSGGVSNNEGNVTIASSLFTGNDAGIFYLNGTTSVSTSTFSGNSRGTDAWGGAITITHSTFSKNTTGITQGGGEATYIANVTHSTFNGNSSGIYNSLGATVNIANSTFFGNGNSGNFGDRRAGLYNNGGTANVINSTFSGNGTNGGIFTYGGSLTLANTILANNPGGDCTGGGPVYPAGVNLVTDGSCDPHALTSDPQLGPLADNGGPTQTMALLPGSPAVDAADDKLCAAAPVSGLDQRGVTRPQGPHCDIGAFEAELMVTTLNDSGIGSLRAAIETANGTPGADAIRFAVSGSIILASPLMITDPQGLTIDGAGQNVVVSGGSKVQVMQVNAGAVLNLKNLTVTKGNSVSAGGGLGNDGTVTITGCTFSGNQSQFFGGGLSNGSSGIVTIIGSTFSGNRSTAGGGLLNISGQVTIFESTFANNAEVSGANNPHGGGIANYLGSITLTNTTLAGNSSNAGGGLWNEYGQVKIISSTVSGNKANTVGGLWNGGTVELVNTIVANNTGGDCRNTDYGKVIPAGVNLVRDGSCDPSALTGNPKLGPLANNGGPTQTMALLPGSPALEAVTDGTCPPPATDQRGVSRPQGRFCDIGAVEKRRKTRGLIARR